MNARQLECVIVLAQERSFSEAAQRLGISQPSLSQYIQKIEAECGNELFERSIPLKLTYAGERYVQHAKNILKSKKQMEDILADVSAEEAGKIVIGTGPINSVTFLPQVVYKFKQRYPKVEIIMKEFYEKELLVKEQNGEVDLAISTRVVDKRKFEYIPLFDEQMVLTVRADSEFAKQHPCLDDQVKEVPVEDCLKLDYVQMDDFFPIQRRLSEMFDRYDTEPSYTVKCGSIMAAYALAKTGIGAVLIPSGAIRYSKDEAMRYYTIKPNPGVRPFGIYYTKGKYISRVMYAFIEQLKEQVPKI